MIVAEEAIGSVLRVRDVFDVFANATTRTAQRLNQKRRLDQTRRRWIDKNHLYFSCITRQGC